MKKLAFALFGVLVVALAVFIAKNLSSEAMAVCAGVVAGIGASIPCMIVLSAMTEQRAESKPAGGAGRTVNIYGPCAIGPGARIVQIGAPQPWRPEDWRHPQPAVYQVPPPAYVMQLPDGRSDDDAQ